MRFFCMEYIASNQYVATLLRRFVSLYSSSQRLGQQNTKWRPGNMMYWKDATVSRGDARGAHCNISH